MFNLDSIGTLGIEIVGSAARPAMVRYAGELLEMRHCESPAAFYLTDTGTSLYNYWSRICEGLHKLL